MNEWLKELKAGDEVCVKLCGCLTDSYKVFTVEKITPSGLIKVNGSLFNPRDGYMRVNDRYCLLNLKDADTQELVEKYNINERKRKFIYRFAAEVDPDNLSIDQIEKIEKILGWCEGD